MKWLWRFFWRIVAPRNQAEAMLRQLEGMTDEDGWRIVTAAKLGEDEAWVKRKHSAPTEFKVHAGERANGEMIEIRRTTDGWTACPVCGWPWPPNREPYEECHRFDAKGNPTGPLCLAGTYEICRCCWFEFGLDDCQPDLNTTQAWQRWRAEWLTRMDREGRRGEAVEQLKNLGLTE